MNLSVSRNDDLVILDVVANSFLHHMVRNIVGSLFEIGDGRKGIGWLRQVLEQGLRSKAGETASAQGLYLAGVEYPDEFEIPHSNINMALFNVCK